MKEDLQALHDTLMEKAKEKLGPELEKVLTEIDSSDEKKAHEVVLKITFKPDRKKPAVYDIGLSCDPKPGKNRPLRGVYSFSKDEGAQELLPFDDGMKKQ